MPLLTKEQIINFDDGVFDIHFEDVPEWTTEGKETAQVGILSFNGNERERFDRWLAEKSDVDVKTSKVKTLPPNVKEEILVRTLCDSNRTLLFARADVKSLGEKHHAVIDRLAQRAQEINGYGDAAIENAEENSEDVQN